MNTHVPLFANQRLTFSLRFGLALVTIATSVVVAFVLLTHSLKPAKAASNFYEITLPSSFPWGVAFDSKGSAWVAEPGCDPQPFMCSGTRTGSIAQVNRSSFSVTKNFTEPSGKGFSSPFFPVPDVSGNIWFAEPNTNAIGELTPSQHNSSATWKQWGVPTRNAAPFQLAFDAHGVLWFTEPLANQIGSFNPMTHAFTETATPTARSTPYGITGPDTNGAMWFTENNAAVARIGSFVPPTKKGTLKTTAISEYLTVNSGPSTTVHLITLDHKGHVWWSEGFGGRIGSLTISKAVKGTSRGVNEYPIPACQNCNSHVSGIAVDNEGIVWFDDSLRNWVDSYNPTTHTFSEPIQLAQGSHPHDGLAVANDDTVFVVEEFAQKLGHAD